METYLIGIGSVVAFIGLVWLANLAEKYNKKATNKAVLLSVVGLLAILCSYFFVAIAGNGLPAKFDRIVQEESAYKIVPMPKLIAVQKRDQVFLIDPTSIPKEMLNEIEIGTGKNFILRGNNIYFK